MQYFFTLKCLEPTGSRSGHSPWLFDGQFAPDTSCSAADLPPSENNEHNAVSVFKLLTMSISIMQSIR